MTLKTRWLAGALMLVSGVALAQGHPGGGAGPMNIDKLEILLDLDGYQKQEVQKILAEQREARKAKREAAENSTTRRSREEMKAQREAAQQVMRAKLAKVLSEPQLKKFDVLADFQPKGRRGNRGARDANR